TMRAAAGGQHRPWPAVTTASDNAASVAAESAAAAAAPAREPYDPHREFPDPLAYAVPSYQQAGKPAGVPLQRPAAPAPAAPAQGGGTLRRVELYLAERLLVAVLDGDRPPLVFTITEP